MINTVKCEKSQYTKVNSVYSLEKIGIEFIVKGSKKCLEFFKKICTNLHKKTNGY